jgi:hypothetical protein
MKKILLNIISLLILIFINNSAIAYETVVVDFPVKEGWHSVYYQSIGKESILQYVPKGQSYSKWTRTIIFHSYKDGRIERDAGRFMNTTTSQMEAQNSSAGYKYIKNTPEDSMAIRCTNRTAIAPAQCEIYKIMLSHEGIMTMHYINKNKQDYVNTYNKWYNIIKNIRIYYSYYRTDRVMDKATYFEM